MPVHIAQNKAKLYLGNKKVKKIYRGGVKVYSAGNICTYHVDTGSVYQEEVDEGASCLTPKTFTPAKAGWTFVGWRMDAGAYDNVYGSLVMGDAPIALYAVFRQTVTLSYNGNGNTGGATASQTGTCYYNNGNVTNPQFTVMMNGFSRTNYIFQVWRLNGTAGTVYAPGATIAPGTNSTLYAEWVVSVSSGDSTAHISFSGSDGGKTDTKYLYLNDAAMNKRMTATVSYDTDNGIFNAVANQMAEIKCGNAVIYSRNYGGASGKNSETKEVSWIQTGKTLTLTVSAHKDKNPNQYTQWCRGTISISGISG